MPFSFIVTAQMRSLWLFVAQIFIKTSLLVKRRKLESLGLFEKLERLELIPRLPRKSFHFADVAKNDTEHSMFCTSFALKLAVAALSAVYCCIGSF